MYENIKGMREMWGWETIGGVRQGEVGQRQMRKERGTFAFRRIRDKATRIDNRKLEGKGRFPKIRMYYFFHLK